MLVYYFQLVVLIKKKIILDWCCICVKSGEEIVDHLLHCEVAMTHWNEFLARVGLVWVMPRKVGDAKQVGMAHVVMMLKLQQYGRCSQFVYGGVFGKRYMKEVLRIMNGQWTSLKLYS